MEEGQSPATQACGISKQARPNSGVRNLNLILAILIAQLGADDFGTRERAHRALAELGPAAHVHLAIAEKSKCPETRARAQLIMNDWYSRNAEALADSHGRLPWITVDPMVETEHLDTIIGELAGGCPFVFDDVDGALRRTTRRWLVMMYRTRAPQAEINDALRRLSDNEADWRRTFGENVPPCLGLPN